jgi:predicted TIM-barrel fold metal-dependent hydrolase
MIDNHIHTGQFEETYYDPIEVIQIVMEFCTEGLCFSSTTTCKDDVSYSEVEDEISNALANIPWPPEIVRPFFWYVPAYAGQGVDFERAMKELPYKGIKLHPLAHSWDLDEKGDLDILHNIFCYAGENKLPILIHTGNSGIDAASTFNRFFPLYTETKIILAHCRPLEEAIFLIRTYPNVYGDTAFLPEVDLRKIVKTGLSHKLVLGSDFPITNYYNCKYPAENKEAMTLKDQYKYDFEQLKHFERLLA